MIAGPKDIANTFFWNNKNKALLVCLRGLVGNRGNAVRGKKKKWIACLYRNNKSIAGQGKVQGFVARVALVAEVPPFGTDGVKAKLSHAFKKQFAVGEYFF